MPIPRKRPSFTTSELLKSVWNSSADSIDRFEAVSASFLDAEDAVFVEGGRQAQFLALKAMDVGKGDRVAVPAYTYPVVPIVVNKLGADVVFVDIEKETYNINPKKFQEVADIVDVVIPTHMYGNPCKMDAIMDIASDNDVKVLEDFSHAFGSLHYGKPVGGIGDVGFASTSISKEPSTVRGGIISSDNSEIIETVRKERDKLVSGQRSSLSVFLEGIRSEIFTTPSIFSVTVFPLMVNTRARSAVLSALKEDLSNSDERELDFVGNRSFQTEIGISQIEDMEDYRKRKRRLWTIYDEHISDSIGKPEEIDEKVKPLTYAIRVENRDSAIIKMAQKGVDCGQGNMRNCANLSYIDGEGGAPVAELVQNKVLTLPMYRDMSSDTVISIARKLNEVARD